MVRKRIPGFDPEAFLERLRQGKSSFGFRERVVIFAQGDPCDAVYYLQTGKIKLTVFSKDGKEAVIGILGPGSFFGEGCIGGQALHTATAITLQDTTVIRLEKKTTMRLLREEPQFAVFFLAYVLSRKIRIEEDLVDQLFNPAQKRLARALLLLAQFGEKGHGDSVVLHISQETLAEMIGTTRSRVNAFMNEFRKEGHIEYRNGLCIHNSLLNVVLKD